MAEALIEGIEQDALKEARTLVEDAKKRAEESIRGAQNRAAGILKQAREKGEERARQFAEREARTVESEVKKIHLKTRDELRKEIMVSIRRELQQLPEKKEYPEILLSWLAEAARGIGSDEGLVYPGRKERELIGPDMLKRASELSGVRLSLADEENKAISSIISGRLGVVVSDREGRIVFDNSMEARIRRMETELRRMIDRELER
jgi:V/A-type H+-transporting ATPase subunit E